MNAAGNKSFETAVDLSSGFTFVGTPFDVSLGGRVGHHAAAENNVDGAVKLPVGVAVEAVV